MADEDELDLLAARSRRRADPLGALDDLATGTDRRAEAGDALDSLIDAAGARPGGEPDGTKQQRQRRWSLALALALAGLALSGFVTDAVAASQLLTSASPAALAVVWPLGGLGLLLMAFLRSSSIDRFARPAVLVRLCFLYAAAFVVVLVLFATDVPTAIPAAMAWLLADQMNFLLPLVVWSLAGDVFTAGQGLKVFPWISRWLFGGQILGLALAAAAPFGFDAINRSLVWLLVIPPVICVAVAIWLPVALRDATTSTGHGRAESSVVAFRSTVEFVRSLPAFRWLLWVSLATMTAGAIIEFSFLNILHGRFDDAGPLQTLYAGTALVGFVACWALQTWFTPRFLRRRGLATALWLLPWATVMAAGIGVIAGVLDATVAAIASVLMWRLLRWSTDASARQAAMATLPDERRARASFLIDLAPVGISFVLVGVAILIARSTGAAWSAPLIALVLAAIAVFLGRRVLATWDDTQLSYKLKRRRRLG